MNKQSHDLATLAFQPFINLENEQFANLSSQAAFHFLNSKTSNMKWGAFMHFFGPTRKLLKIGGLDLEDENFLHINTTNVIWNNLTSKYLKNELNIDESIILIRSLFYLGFYKNALYICDELNNKSQTTTQIFWIKYLKEVGNSLCEPHKWSANKLIQDIELCKIKDISPFLYFHISLLIIKYYIRNSFNAELAKSWIKKTNLLITNFNRRCDQNLAKIRLMKYEADFNFLINKSESAVLLLNKACEIADESVVQLNQKSNYIYLFKETKRRLLDTLTLFFCNKNKLEAIKYAKQSIELDPYCSYAHLLLSFASSTTDPLLAAKHLKKTAEYGIIERPYAIYKIENEEDTESDIKPINECLFLIPDKKLNNNTFKLPIGIEDLKSIAENYSDSIRWSELKNTRVYKFTLPFWELNSTLNQPLFCHTPLNAYEVFQKNEDPWFETQYLQRALPNNFREELFFAVSTNTLFAKNNLSKNLSLNILENRSTNANIVLSNYLNIENLTGLKRTSFCRLLASLGFYKEAISGLKIPDKNSAWSFEDEYAFCSKLFFEYVNSAGSNTFSHLELDFAFEKLSLEKESFRMKLILSMLGCVYHGRKGNIIKVLEWKEKGSIILNKILNITIFNDFEKTLLLSRFYRASSYFAFLSNNKKMLQNEANQCEFYARTLITKSKKEDLLKKENLFPMLESTARIFDFLGDGSQSISRMEEIIQKVDPLDAKAWIQVGELKEKYGDLKNALTAFQEAINIGIPLGAIASYKAGRICEKMEEYERAKDYYLQSLQLNPQGLSPVKRIFQISSNFNDLYLKKWSEIQLKNTRSLIELKT